MSHESSQWLSFAFDAHVSICLHAASYQIQHVSRGLITAGVSTDLSHRFHFVIILRPSFDLQRPFPQTEVSSILYLGLLTDVVAWQRAADGSVDGGQTVNTEVALLALPEYHIGVRRRQS